MLPIEARIERRGLDISRLVAAVEEDARCTALVVIRNDRNAVKRVCRYHLATNLREINRYFRPLPDVLDALNRRIDFRSSWERTAPIDLRGARLAVKIVMRREREEARAMARAAE